MEILNSGSFVTLDNREKIEQLIFTATTLASEVSRTNGFQSSGATNHQLGLEMWKGAEYMCRAHEEATIRNLFLSKFLEKLREIERQNAIQPSPAQAQIGNPPTARTETQHAPVPNAAVPASESDSAMQPQEARDDYLGLIPPTLEIGSGRASYADECKPEFEREFAETGSVSETEEIIAAAGESKQDEVTLPSKTSLNAEPTVTEAGIAEVPASGTDEEPVTEHADSAEPPTSDFTPKVDPIVLSEKEPYNFDSCTVTTVIQLLPESGGVRKSVISIRSHDFAPQISISSISNGDVHEGAHKCLETALEQYRSNLPALAAEKVKKQKPAGKKRSTKTVDKDAMAEPEPASKTSAVPTVPPTAQNSEAGKDQRNLFAS